MIYVFQLEVSDKLREADLVNWQSSLCTWQVCLPTPEPSCTLRMYLGNQDKLMGHFPPQLLSCGLVLPGVTQACCISPGTVNTTKWPEYVRQSLPLAENLWYPDAACLSKVSVFSPLVPMDALFRQTESLSTQPASKAWKGMMSLLKGAINSVKPRLP